MTDEIPTLKPSFKEDNPCIQEENSSHYARSAMLSTSQKQDVFWGAATVGFLSFILYVATLPPSVVGGDSGEIVVSAWKLALPHPPGRVYHLL
jgi:hypothetical protein